MELRHRKEHCQNVVTVKHVIFVDVKHAFALQEQLNTVATLRFSGIIKGA